MAMEKRFSKLCCGGNDFIIIDSRENPPPENIAALARTLCTRRLGIGADGLILLVQDPEFPFRILLYNADGSRAEVSLNGSRCVGRYAYESGITSAEFSFASGAGPIGVKVSGNRVSLRVPPPEKVKLHMEVKSQDEIVRGHSLKVGVPYFVIFQDDLNYSWIERVPPRLRTNPAFPEGTNIAVACRRGAQSYEARFFERGVEEETLSSGSGCVAVALIASLRTGAHSPVTVRTKGGDFAVSFTREGDKIGNITTSGKVFIIYKGEIAEELLIKGSQP